MQLTPDFFSRSDNKIHFITLISDKDLTTASNHAQCSTNEKHGAVKYSNKCFIKKKSFGKIHLEAPNWSTTALEKFQKM